MEKSLKIWQAEANEFCKHKIDIRLFFNSYRGVAYKLHSIKLNGADIAAALEIKVNQRNARFICGPDGNCFYQKGREKLNISDVNLIRILTAIYDDFETWLNDPEYKLLHYKNINHLPHKRAKF